MKRPSHPISSPLPERRRRKQISHTTNAAWRNPNPNLNLIYQKLLEEIDPTLSGLRRDARGGKEEGPNGGGDEIRWWARGRRLRVALVATRGQSGRGNIKRCFKFQLQSIAFVCFSWQMSLLCMFVRSFPFGHYVQLSEVHWTLFDKCIEQFVPNHG